MRPAIIIPLALSLVFAPAIMAQSGGSNPNCPDGFDAAVSGPENCDCTSNDLPWDPVHWDDYKGPTGQGELKKDDGTPVTGRISGGSTGFTGTYSPTITVPAGKCIQIVYDFYCCSVEVGTNCNGTGSMTFVESIADCD